MSDCIFYFSKQSVIFSSILNLSTELSGQVWVIGRYVEKLKANYLTLVSVLSSHFLLSMSFWCGLAVSWSIVCSISSTFSTQVHALICRLPLHISLQVYVYVYQSAGNVSSRFVLSLCGGICHHHYHHQWQHRFGQSLWAQSKAVDRMDLALIVLCIRQVFYIHLCLLEGVTATGSLHNQ